MRKRERFSSDPEVCRAVGLLGGVSGRDSGVFRRRPQKQAGEDRGSRPGRRLSIFPSGNVNFSGKIYLQTAGGKPV
jgi:hypothetical protein